jgi:3-hydroxyisobutyrate dehydrogenase-like beta-hydroxyacid dehydrogenase
MTRFAILGFGELGSALAGSLAAVPGSGLTVFTRARSGDRAAQLEESLRELGATAAGSAGEAVRGAEVVIAAVPGSASAEVFESCAAALEPATLYADLSSAAPRDKVRAAGRAAEGGVRYADAAVLGTVAAGGGAVPILASGDGAAVLRDLLAPAGIRVEAADAPAGHASTVKLLRSVYLKGRDALIAEMLAAAQRLGLVDAVIDSIASAPSEQGSFDELADRVLKALAVHAERRAGELELSGELVRGTGVEPLMAEAGAERLRRIAALGLRDALGGERPQDANAVLDALERLREVPPAN